MLQTVSRGFAVEWLFGAYVEARWLVLTSYLLDKADKSKRRAGRSSSVD